MRPLLEPRFTVWAVDRRGRGDSGDGERYSIALEFDDVAAVVRAAGDGAALFGHSYGALVSAGAAGRLEGLERLVLYEPPMGGVLDRLDVACLLLVGSESPDWARRSTDAFAGAVSGVQVRTLEGHGHGAAVSAPALLAGELERFLLPAPRD